MNRHRVNKQKKLINKFGLILISGWLGACVPLTSSETQEDGPGSTLSQTPPEIKNAEPRKAQTGETTQTRRNLASIENRKWRPKLLLLGEIARLPHQLRLRYFDAIQNLSSKLELAMAKRAEKTAQSQIAPKDLYAFLFSLMVSPAEAFREGESCRINGWQCPEGHGWHLYQGHWYCGRSPQEVQNGYQQTGCGRLPASSTTPLNCSSDGYTCADFPYLYNDNEDLHCVGVEPRSSIKCAQAFRRVYTNKPERLKSAVCKLGNNPHTEAQIKTFEQGLKKELDELEADSSQSMDDTQKVVYEQAIPIAKEVIEVARSLPPQGQEGSCPGGVEPTRQFNAAVVAQQVAPRAVSGCGDAAGGIEVVGYTMFNTRTNQTDLCISRTVNTCMLFLGETPKQAWQRERISLINNGEIDRVAVVNGRRCLLSTYADRKINWCSLYENELVADAVCRAVNLNRANSGFTIRRNAAHGAAETFDNCRAEDFPDLLTRIRIPDELLNVKKNADGSYSRVCGGAQPGLVAQPQAAIKKNAGTDASGGIIPIPAAPVDRVTSEPLPPAETPASAK